MDFQRQQADQEKERIKDQITSILCSLCTGNKQSCHWGFCNYNDVCAKIHFSNGHMPKKKLKLKSMLKNLLGRENKKVGRSSPFHLGNNVHEIASTLVGCNIYDHELIKGCTWAEVAIKRCTKLNQINAILDRRHIDIHGKSKLWNYDPKYYKRR